MTSDSAAEQAGASPLTGVGEQLRRARQAAGISVREMARRVDVSPSFISQVELGRTKPSVGTLYAIASELGVPLDDLMPIGQALPEPAAPPARPVPEGDDRLQLIRRGVLRPFDAEPENTGSEAPVQRADRRHELRMGSAVWGRLTADHDPDNDFLHVVYAPGGESCPADNMIHHRGHEYGYVIAGLLDVQVGFTHYTLHAGDSISFASTTPHRLSNPGGVDSVSLWMVVGRGGTPVL